MFTKFLIKESSNPQKKSMLIAKLSRGNLRRYLTSQNKSFGSAMVREGNRSHIHFKLTPTPHPLGAAKNIYEVDDMVAGDHTGRQQNHIWSKAELQEKMSTLYRHKPQTIADRITHTVVS